VLYHGTTRRHIASIQTHVNVALATIPRDFGIGFYTTTVLRQARTWANIKSAWDRWNNVQGDTNPCVIEFRVDRTALGRLHTLSFVRGDREASDFWDLFDHCRFDVRRTNRPPNGGWYDVVFGPVAKKTDPTQRRVFSGYDQISFHTPQAAQLLAVSDIIDAR
jgi:hypothetical protein